MKKPFGSMRRPFVGGGAILVLLAGLVIQPVQAQRVLFHGDDVDPTAGDDAAVLAHLEALFGPANVTYMQAAMAAPNGSSAIGFDAVVVSSTTNSGDLLKYADSPVGVLNWEQALTRDDRAGEYQLSTGGATTGGQTEINIVDPAHPLAAGLSGTVPVFNTPHTMSHGTGTLGGGVDRVASLASGANHAIMAAEVGAPLLGDGSAGRPAVAPGRRVMFFLENTGFADLTPEGIDLFNTALDFVLDVIPPLPVQIGGEGTIGEATLPIGNLELETTQEATSVAGLTMNVYKDVNLGSNRAWTEFLAGVPAPAASGTVPWISWDEVPDNAAEVFAPNSYADAQPILDADLENDGDAAAPNFSNYSVRMTGEIRIPSDEVRFKDGNDDYAYLAIDLDGNDQIDAGEVLIDDNNWAPWNGTDANDGDPSSPIVLANFSGSLTGEDAWRKVEFRMAEGGGDDNAALFWDQNPGGSFDEFTTDDFFLTDDELVPQDSFRTFQEEITSATLTTTLRGVRVFDVLVDQIDWDRILVEGPDAATVLLDLEGSEFQINVLDPENLTSGFTIDLVRDENIDEISGTPSFNFLNTDEDDWDTSTFNVNGQLTFTGGGAPGIPGDFNGNDLVEQEDLDLVLANWGDPAAEAPATWVNDLPTGNIDQTELDKVLVNWGNTAGLGTAAGVPEPSSIALLLVVAGLGLGLWRKHA